MLLFLQILDFLVPLLPATKSRYAVALAYTELRCLVSIRTCRVQKFRLVWSSSAPGPRPLMAAFTDRLRNNLCVYRVALVRLCRRGVQQIKGGFPVHLMDGIVLRGVDGEFH